MVAGFDGLEATPITPSELTLKQQVQALVTEGIKPNAAIKTVAQNNQIKKQVVYKAYHEIEAPAE